MEEEVVVRIQIDDAANQQKVDQLTAEIAELNDETRKLAESNKALARDNKTSSDAFNKSSKQIELNKQEIKQNVATRGSLIKSLQSEKVNMDKTLQSVTSLTPAFGGAAQGALGFVNVLKSLGPVGAILALIGGAFALIKAAIEKSEPALDFFENVMTKIGAVVDVLLVNIKEVGSIIGNVLTLNFSAAAAGISNLANKMEEAADAAQLYLDLSRDLEDAQFKFRQETAATENEIKKLVIASRNRNLTLDEQEKILDQVLEKERDLVRQREDLARREAVIGIKKIALEKDVKQSSDETFEQFVTNIRESGKFSEDELDKILTLYEKQKDAASASLAFTEKIENQKDAIAEKRRAANEKEIAQAEALRKYIEGVINSLPSVQAQKAEKEKVDQDKRLEGLRKFTDEQVKLNLDADKAILQGKESLDKKVEESTKKNRKFQIDSIRDFLQDLAKAIQATLQTTGNIIAGFNNAAQGAYDNRIAELENQQAENQQRIDERSDYELQKLEEQHDKQLISDQEYNAQKQALDKKFKGYSEASEKSSNEKITEIKKQAFEENKKNQVALGIIATFQSALQAFQSLIGVPIVGQILAPIAAAAALAFGFKNVDNIRNTPFSAAAGGGDFITKGPTLLLVGDNPGGRERVSVEPLSGRGKTVINPRGNLIAAAGGIGNPSFLGIETRNAASGAESSLNMNRLISMIGRQQVVLVYDDVEAKANIKSEITTRAKVA